jgi:GDPmannose 4,6-dehydratase
MKKCALICGVSGQDGAYLAQLLLEKGYHVIGTSRDSQGCAFTNLQKLGLRKDIECCSMVLTDFRSTLQTLARVKPDEIYNMAGQSSVGLSFEQPVEAFESVGLGTLNLLEAVRFLDSPVRVYNASSSECFGDTEKEGATEASPFRPRSPYAVAKAASHWAVVNYRESYGLFAVNGILSNHESPLRPKRFVTRKIISAAFRIKAGHDKSVRLGNLAIHRDWGWAPEYVDAMWRMVQLEKPEDFVVGTGKAYSLENFVETAFAMAGLDWRTHVELDDTLHRPSDIMFNKVNAAKAFDKLAWKAKHSMPSVVEMMLEAEQGLA